MGKGRATALLADELALALAPLQGTDLSNPKIFGVRVAAPECSAPGLTPRALLLQRRFGNASGMELNQEPHCCSPTTFVFVCFLLLSISFRAAEQHCPGFAGGD